MGFIQERTDKYFTRTRKVVEHFGEKQVTYGFFIRREVVVALQRAIDFINHHCAEAVVTRHYEDGTLVPSSAKLMTVTGPFSKLVELETLVLQRIGFSCVCAYNAYKMSMAMPKVKFIDMHARHATGDDMNHAASYGASVGSKLANKLGAIGFIGGAQDITAHYYGKLHGIGTMPHALIGYAGSTEKAVRMYLLAQPEEKAVTALVDYYGTETKDTIAVASMMQIEFPDVALSVRLDTHGGRFAEGLDYEKSVKIVCDWLHVTDEFEAVKIIMGDRAYDMDILNIGKDKVRKILFGPGVSVANVINLRQKLNAGGFNNVTIVGSSGFDLHKCEVFAAANAPIDFVGTGSLLPSTITESYATADIFKYNDEYSVKVGREFLFK